MLPQQVCPCGQLGQLLALPGLCPGSPVATGGLGSPVPPQTGLAELSVRAEPTTLLERFLLLWEARSSLIPNPGSCGQLLPWREGLGWPQLSPAVSGLGLLWLRHFQVCPGCC